LLVSDFLARPVDNRRVVARGGKGDHNSGKIGVPQPVLALQFNSRTNISLHERFQWQHSSGLARSSITCCCLKEKMWYTYI